MKNKILRRKFTIIVAVYIALVLILWTVYNNTVFTHFKRTVSGAINMTKNNILTSLSDEFSRMKLASFSIAGSSHVQDFLAETNITEFYKQSSAVTEIVRNAIYQQAGEETVLALKADGSFFQFTGSLSNDAVSVIHNEVVKDNVTAYSVLELDGAVYFCISNPVYRQGFVSERPVGHIVMLSDVVQARRILTKPDTIQGIDTFIILDGVILLSSNVALDGRESAELDTLYGSVTVSQISNTNLYAASAVTEETMYYSERLFIQIAAVTFILLIISVAVFYRMLSSKMVSPMMENAAAMQMGLLKMQIDDHFVAKTILNIAKLSREGETEKAAVSAENLAALFTALHEPDMDMNIYKQFQNLNRYIEIMNIRHGGKFNVEINDDDRLCKYRILGQILQPLVENSFLHGFENKTDDCRVIVTGILKDDCVIFEVADNGTGLTREKAAALQDALNAADEWDYDDYRLKGVAMINIQKRIRALYGKGYGLTVKTNEPEPGLTVTARLPLIEDKD